MKIRARLAYSVILQAEVPDVMRAFISNPQVLLDQAQMFAKPAFAAAIAGLIGKLKIMGIGVHSEDADLKFQVEPEKV